MAATSTHPERGATTAPRTRHESFLQSAARFPERPALVVGGEELSYAQLSERSRAIAATLQRDAPRDGPPLTAVFAHRTTTAYAGVLAALLRGHGYVPLNRTFPPERTRLMLKAAGCRTIIADEQSAEQLPEILDGLGHEVHVLRPDAPGADLAPADAWTPPAVGPDDLAYLLFTSGSTGRPKGVMIAQRNVTAYVEAIAERYAVTEHDRFSQTAELTFDNSVLDMFVPWSRGAAVCCPTQKELINPSRFIRANELTVWFSVPSTAIFMKRLKALKPGSFPSLRWSLFAGEPLPVEIASAWLEAAPNSTVENLYGPTEVTDVCVLYRWDPDRSPADVEAGSVPTGHPLGDMRAIVVDDHLREVPPGGTGELLVCGPQVGPGYWHEPEKTAAAFVVPPGRTEIHYRTGDRVRRPARPDGPITYLGRIDFQVQVFGERIELGEVEAALRAASGVDLVAAVGWPRTATGASGIEAFVGDAIADGPALARRLREILPTHMAPRRVHALGDMPLNANGKIDRGALMARLDEEAAR